MASTPERKRIVSGATREHVVAIAQSWLDTPFHDGCSLKGAGADCAGLLRGVFIEAGLIEDFEPLPYSPQFFLHSNKPIFLSIVERYAHRVRKEELEAGDVIMYDFGLQAAHGAIVVDAHTIIHAFQRAGGVCRSDRRQFRPYENSFWSLF